MIPASTKVSAATAVIALCMSSFAVPANAQSADLPQAAIDHIAEADRIAGDDRLMQIMRTYHCYYVDPEDSQFRPSPSDRNDLLFGTKLLDNVTYLGYPNVGSYAIETSEGLVFLDGGADPDDGPKFEAWLEDAGFSADDIAYIIVTHEHGDHFGAVPHLLGLNPDIKLVAGAAATWNEVMSPFTPVELAVSERTELTVGDTEFVFVPTPGHTPGTISAFITVQSQGETYWSAFWGGKGMRPDAERSRQMLESSVVFAEESDNLGVRIPLNTHGWGDASFSRMIEHVLMPDAPNPFIMTSEQVQANNKILEHCTAAYLEGVESGAIAPRS